MVFPTWIHLHPALRRLDPNGLETSPEVAKRRLPDPNQEIVPVLLQTDQLKNEPHTLDCARLDLSVGGRVRNERRHRFASHHNITSPQPKPLLPPPAQPDSNPHARHKSGVAARRLAPSFAKASAGRLPPHSKFRAISRAFACPSKPWRSWVVPKSRTIKPSRTPLKSGFAAPSGLCHRSPNIPIAHADPHTKSGIPLPSRPSRR